MTVRSATALLLLLAACAPAAEEAPEAVGPQVVTYTATDFEFAGPDSIAPGYTAVRLVNKGAQVHHLMLARLDDGKTMQDIMTAMQTNPDGEPEWVKFVGGAGGVPPGDSTAGISDLAAGHYVMFCFVPDPADGTPHLAKGMMKELVVAGERHAGEAPAVAGDIRLSEFAFDAPAMTAGTHTFKIINDGQLTHEVFLVKLNDGVTAEQFMAASGPGATAPPPGRAIGGNGALSKGRENYWTVSLTPGTYLMLCFVPDPADGAPHVAKGMMREITVT